MPTPLMTNFTNQVLTSTFETDELTLVTVTSTAVPFSTRQTNQQKKDQGIDDTTLYVEISATVGGVVTVISVSITILYYRRFQMLSQCKISRCSGGANTMYGTLSLPSSANVIDNSGISNNYSSLNINDYQSTIDNKQ